MIPFFVRGIPKPKGSARAFAVRTKAGPVRAVVTNDCKTSRAWEGDVRAEARRVAPPAMLEGAIEVVVTFILPRPKSVSPRRRPCATTKPDLDKLTRTVFDACTGVIWRDDAQVVSVTARKRYVLDGEPSGARVAVYDENEREMP